MKIEIVPLEGCEDLVPRYAHFSDAAVDLCCSEGFYLDFLERKAVPCGFKIALPEGWAGLILPRSGISLKRGVAVVNSPGLIDSGYRGEIKVPLISFSRERQEFSRGERIAQFLALRAEKMEFARASFLPPSDRGEGGFGSTGM
ncbi:MAG: dUTP diphosphatase [Aeriscardovia sp.]|nr:dUTP diphosphatase [Aeriscardovia sp.]